jgi:patatin-like phospholipase/acyl hydrolase
MTTHIAARLHRPGPKRILALDGGGTRGVITLAFLAEIEATLQTKLGRGDEFVLADYFDMIGGTSVGSILATMLALGWRVETIEEDVHWLGTGDLQAPHQHQRPL